MKVKNEKIFRHFASNEFGYKVDPTKLGCEQFVLHQSNGVIPNEPDPYYEFLTRGKWGFDFICKEYLDSYNRSLAPYIDEFETEKDLQKAKLTAKTYGWPGFELIWEDWRGNRWILPHVLKWYPKLTSRKLPSWITSETITLSEIENKIMQEYITT